MPSSSFAALMIRQGIDALADLLACLRFFTRVPLPAWSLEAPWTPETFGRMLRFAPLAGVLVGSVAALGLALALDGLGLPRFVAATIAVASEILVSGGLHEDGLADVADGFGGGSTKTGKLEIMRDSRIGTFGVLALVLTAALRVGLLTGLLDRYGLAAAAAGLAAAASASRGFCLVPLAALPPARSDGLGHTAGVPRLSSVAAALTLAVFLGVTLAYAGGLSEGRSLAACGAALMAALVVTLVSHRHIAGQTGDVAGATQQLSALAFLAALLIAPGLG